MFKGTIHYRTHLEAPVEKVWNFFQYNRNLAEITSFPRITLQGDETVFEGAELELKMNFFVIRLSWESRITRVQPYRFFMDEGKKLPFPFLEWKHKHEFMEMHSGRTLMTDQVRFRSVIPAFIVKMMLFGMFADRGRRVKQKLYNN